MAFHRTQHSRTATPRACFITPVDIDGGGLPLPSRDFLRQSATYIDTLHFTVRTGTGTVSGARSAASMSPGGVVTIEVEDETVVGADGEFTRDNDNSSGGGQEQQHTVFANVWDFDYAGRRVRLVESTRTRMPLLLQVVSCVWIDLCDPRGENETGAGRALSCASPNCCRWFGLADDLTYMMCVCSYDKFVCRTT